MASKVLFLCVHNSARSQMAEAYLKIFGGDNFIADSAGLEPGTLNPIVVEAMKKDGIDISGNLTKDVFEYFKQGKIFHYVITVCDPEASERCPIFPGVIKKINWGFSDPSKFEGTHDERLEQTIKVRNQIKEAVINFINEQKSIVINKD